MRLQQGGTGSSEAAVARRAPQLGSRVSSYEFGLRFASRSNWTPTSAFLGRTAFVFSWSCRLGAQGRATTPRTGEHKEYWTPTYADCVCFFFGPAVLARRAGRPPRELANTRTIGHPRMRTAFAVFCFGPVVLARRAGRPPRELANTRTIGHPRMRTAFAFFCPAVLARRAGRPPREFANTRDIGDPSMRTAFAVFFYSPAVLARRAGRPPRELANTRTAGRPRMRTAFAVFFWSCCLGAQGRATIPRTGGRPPRELVHSISGPTC